MDIVSVKQSLFLKKWAEDIFNHLQLNQTYLKIRPKCQINTCTENKALTRNKTLGPPTPPQTKPGQLHMQGGWKLESVRRCTFKVQNYQEKQ